MTETASVAQVLITFGGLFLLGLLADLAGRIRHGEPTQAEALGAVLLCAGLAEWLGVSYILSAMILGTVVANLAKHHERPFTAIKGIEWPFLILFFLLAGAALKVDSLAQSGLLLVAYILLRGIGLTLGAFLGGWVSGLAKRESLWFGCALLPHAGVAIGMALLASQRDSSVRDIILPIILASTIIFELIGPVTTRIALVRAGNIPTFRRVSQPPLKQSPSRRTGHS